MPSPTPQLNLRLDVAVASNDVPWRAGGTIACLGHHLTLVLDTAAREPVRIDAELHLPLPPAATPRQIRDAAESWLRDEALRCFTAIVRQKSALAGRQPPGIALTFGKRGDWARHEGDMLRCHWRLIEQPRLVVEQVLGQALKRNQASPVSDDLFALV
jgi:predicted metal-dependent hydrolase